MQMINSVNNKQVVNPIINIEPIYQSAMEQMNRRPGGITLTKDDMKQMHPVLGMLAGMIVDSVTFKMHDLEKLYQYIMEG